MAGSTRGSCPSTGGSTSARRCTVPWRCGRKATRPAASGRGPSASAAPGGCAASRNTATSPGRARGWSTRNTAFPSSTSSRSVFRSARPGFRASRARCSSITDAPGLEPRPIAVCSARAVSGCGCRSVRRSSCVSTSATGWAGSTSPVTDCPSAAAIVALWTSSSGSTIDRAALSFLHWRLYAAYGVSESAYTTARADGGGTGESRQRGAVEPVDVAAHTDGDSVSLALPGRPGEVRVARQRSRGAARFAAIRLCGAAGPRQRGGGGHRRLGAMGGPGQELSLPRARDSDAVGRVCDGAADGATVLGAELGDRTVWRFAQPEDTLDYMVTDSAGQGSRVEAEWRRRGKMVARSRTQLDAVAHAANARIDFPEASARFELTVVLVDTAQVFAPALWRSRR